MTEFTISLAGIPICVRAIFARTERFCSDYLSDETPCVCFSVTEEDLRCEQIHADRTAREEGQTPRIWDAEYLEQLALYRKIAEDLKKTEQQEAKPDLTVTDRYFIFTTGLKLLKSLNWNYKNLYHRQELLSDTDS